MMTKQNKSIHERIKELKIIYNDDCKILDFLADLKDREPLRSLQRFINYGNLQKIGLLFKCPDDNLTVLILYMTPLLNAQTSENKLTLFADRDLMFMATYFLRWLENVKEWHPEQKGTIKALQEINDLLYNQLENDKNTKCQPQKLG